MDSRSLPPAPQLPTLDARLLVRPWRWPLAFAQWLTHWPWTETLRTLAARFKEEHLALTAGSLTFLTLMALVPLMTVMLALFSAFPLFHRFQVSLQDYFLRSLVPDTIARPVMQSLLDFAAKASKMGSVGLIVLVATALSLMLTIDKTLNAIWRVQRLRSMGRRLPVYWFALTVGPLLLGISLSITSYAVSASKGLVTRMPQLLGFGLSLLQFGLMVLGFAGLFRTVPNTHVAWRHAFAGALFVGIGFEVAKAGLAWYVSTVPTYSAIYGAFASVPIMMLWVYLSWVIVLLGAVLAAYIPSLVSRVVRLPDRPGERFALALSVLGLLAKAQRSGRPGMDLDSIALALRVDPLQVGTVLDELQDLHWAGRLEEEGNPRWVLLVAPATTPIRPLVDRLLLREHDGSRAFRDAGRLDAMHLADALAA